MRETSKPGTQDYRAGDYWAICDVCGFKYLRSDMRVRWDKALVCSKDYEIRHPQETIRPGKDRIVPRDEIRPEGTDTFVVTPVTQDDL